MLTINSTEYDIVNEQTITIGDKIIHVENRNNGHYQVNVKSITNKWCNASSYIIPNCNITLEGVDFKSNNTGSKKTVVNQCKFEKGIEDDLCTIQCNIGNNMTVFENVENDIRSVDDDLCTIQCNVGNNTTVFENVENNIRSVDDAQKLEDKNTISVFGIPKNANIKISGPGKTVIRKTGIHFGL